MRVKVVSDVHGNFPALKEATENDDAADYHIFCGDIVGLGGYISECVDYLKENYDIVIKGNHDVATVEKREGHVNSKQLSEYEMRLVREQLSDSQEEYVRNLDSMVVTRLPDDSKVVVAHAKPVKGQSDGIKMMRNTRGAMSGMDLGSTDQTFDYVSTNGVMPKDYTRYLSDLGEHDVDYGFLGHTHKQSHAFGEKFDGDLAELILNPGSVGQSHDSQPTYSVFDTETNEVEEYKVDIHREELCSRAREMNCPTPNLFCE